MGQRLFGWRSLVLAIAVALGATGAQAQTLGSNDVAIARELPVDDLIRTLDQGRTHPITMLLLAKRLYDLDRRDEAVFWFYAGQLRWRACLRQNPSCGGSEQFGRLFETIGPDLNQHGFRTLAALQSTVNAVLAWDESHPDPFTTDPATKEQQRQGMRDMVAYAQAHSAELDARHAELAREDAARGGDPYGGEGGALFGMPQELLTQYDPTRFAAFRPGVTTRAEVLSALGRPEYWSNDGAGLTFGYSYLRLTDVSAAIGMSERVQVSIVFNRANVLTRVGLPSG
ncbi:MAG: hypothetical protein HY054_04685 [Proteobacteria bacterium]|nr:hypothetical protein [Pseudomonadota bacterium]